MQKLNQVMEELAQVKEVHEAQGRKLRRLSAQVNEFKERSKKIESLLIHASSCAGCTTRPCKKMKSLIAHFQSCVEGDCEDCMRFEIYLEKHTFNCKLPKGKCACRLATR